MRVRKVVFLYYLEDDTLQISEPKQDNSGLPQVLSYLCKLTCRLLVSFWHGIAKTVP